MDLAQRINAIIEPTVNDMGFTLVRSRLSGENRMELQIMAERTDGGGMNVDDCANLSRAISALLDVEDPIAGAFTLEVSSPGIDRPLVKIEDFQRFDGLEARIETMRPVDGRKRFKGRLAGVNDNIVAIKTDTGDHNIPYGDITRAKLLMSDELLAKAAEKGLS